MFFCADSNFAESARSFIHFSHSEIDGLLEMRTKALAKWIKNKPDKFEERIRNLSKQLLNKAVTKWARSIGDKPVDDLSGEVSISIILNAFDCSVDEAHELTAAFFFARDTQNEWLAKSFQNMLEQERAAAIVV